MDSVCRVVLSNLGKTIEVKKGSNLLQELKRNKIYMKSSCGGVASCGDCNLKIIKSNDSLSERTFAESKLLGNVYHITKERLSCQAEVLGDLEIDISRHDQSMAVFEYGEEAFVQKREVENNQNPVLAPKKTLLRKSNVVEEKRRLEESERTKRDLEKNQKSESWFKHWDGEEKTSDAVKKKRGGGRRVRPFKFKKREE